MQVGGVEFITSAATRRERRWRGSHAPCDSHYKGKVHTYDTTAPFLAVAKKDKATQRADAAARKCSVAPLNGYSAVTQCPSAAGLMRCTVRTLRAHCSHAADVRSSVLGVAQCYPGASRSPALRLSDIGPLITLGLPHAVVFTTGQA